MNQPSTIDIVRAAWDDLSRLIPCLWGPPRRGKTFSLRQAALEYTGSWDNVRVINPALDLPEDTGGVLRVKSGRAYYTLPPAIPQSWLDNPEGRYVLIIDEIDKASDEVLCTLLTLLSHERRIRDVKMPSGLRIACAGNEPKAPLPEPLIGRMLHLRFPTGDDVPGRLQTFDALTNAANSWLPEVARQILTTPSISLPARVSGDDSITALLSWSAWPQSQMPEVRSRLVEGLFRREDVPAILGALERDELDKDHFSEWIEKAPLAVITGRLHKRLGEADEPGSVQSALISLSNRADSDQSGEFGRALQALLTSPEALATLGMPEPRDISRGKASWAKQLLKKKLPVPPDPWGVIIHNCGHTCLGYKKAHACGSKSCGGWCDCGVCAERN